MALVELASGRRPEARALLAALLAMPARHPVALVARARLDLVERNVDAAERHLREALELDPEVPLARLDLGGLLLARSRAPEAVEILEKAAARGQFDAPTRISLARARLATGDGAGATRELETILSEHPDEVPALVTLAEARLLAGDPAEARRLAERALTLDRRSAHAALVAGRAARAEGNEGRARRFLARAARTGGDTTEGREARRALMAARAR
jgi:predicted Zn-dependent protease